MLILLQLAEESIEFETFPPFPESNPIKVQFRTFAECVNLFLVIFLAFIDDIFFELGSC
jgi:hypothetical protein